MNENLLSRRAEGKQERPRNIKSSSEQICQTRLQISYNMFHSNLFVKLPLATCVTTKKGNSDFPSPP